MGRYFKGFCPHVNFLINVDTGDDEEHAWPPGSPREEAAQSEDHSPLILLDNLKRSRDLLIIYSAIRLTLMVNRRERGSVQRTIRRLAMVIRSEHTPGPSSQETETFIHHTN